MTNDNKRLMTSQEGNWWDLIFKTKTYGKKAAKASGPLLTRTNMWSPKLKKQMENEDE